jgi:pyruvate-formate lyase
MAEINTWLITQPPQSFREACQWMAWYLMAARMYNGSGALGRPGQSSSRGGSHRALKQPLQRGQLRVRGLFRVACQVIASALMVNVRRIQKARSIDPQQPFFSFWPLF